MKKLIAIVFLFLIIGTNSFAEPVNQSETSDKIILESRDIKNGGKNQPRIPARHNEVECFYQDGYLHLTFEYSEGNAILSITDLMDTPHLVRQFSTAMPFSIFIGEPNEPLKIEIKTDFNSYEGVLSRFN